MCAPYTPLNWMLIGLCSGFAAMLAASVAIAAFFFWWQRRLMRLAVRDKKKGPPGERTSLTGLVRHMYSGARSACACSCMPA